MVASAWGDHCGAREHAQAALGRYSGRRLGVDIPAYPVDARPTVLMQSAKKMRFHGSTIELSYYGPSHTDSDIWAYFVEQNVLATGDTFWNGVYPFIDNENGGSIDGMIRAANANIAKAGPTRSWYRSRPSRWKKGTDCISRYVVAIRAKVAQLRQQG